MTPTEELDLARAKAICRAHHIRSFGANNPAVDIEAGVERDYELWLDDAVAMRLSDAARGLAVVPMELTADMNAEYVATFANSAAQSAWDTRKEAYAAMLAASPYAEKAE